MPYPREPAVQGTGNLVHHSEGDPQYVAIRYTGRLAEAEIEASVGSVGDNFYTGRVAVWFRNSVEEKGSGFVFQDATPAENQKMRQSQIQTPQLHRDHVRPPQELAACRRMRRQLPGRFLFSCLPRSNCHTLAMRLE